MASETARIARAVLDERKRIADWLLTQRIAEPVGETEEHTNYVVWSLSDDIAHGRYLR